MGFFLFHIPTYQTLGDAHIATVPVPFSLSQFNKRKHAEGKSALLTDAQQEWLTVQQLMATTKPEKKFPKPSQPLRRLAYSIVQSKNCDLFMVFVILANMGTMFLTHQGESKQWAQALSLSNLAFTSIFVLEMVLKLMAIGYRAYFMVRGRDSWVSEQRSLLTEKILCIEHRVGFEFLRTQTKYGI